MPPEASVERWKALGIQAWTIIGVLILVIAALWGLGAIFGAVVPFIMAAVIVFLLRGPVARLEKDGLPRWAALTLCYIASFVLFVGAMLFVLPVLTAQFVQFVRAFPTYYAQAAQTFTDLTARYWTPAPGWFRTVTMNLEKGAEAQLGTVAQGAAGGLFSAGSSVFTFLLDAVLALFIAFYILLDLPQVRAAFVAMGGTRRRDDAEVVLHEISTVLGGFLRGQFVIAVANGVLTAIGLFLVGIPYSGIIGLITGVLSIVPFIGPLIGGAIVVVTGLFISPTKALLGLAIMIGVQQVEGNLLSPRIMSREVDLHPALVIFSLLAGAEVGGVLGMIVAIPVAATGKALFLHYSGRRASAAATTGGSGRTTATPPEEPMRATGPRDRGVG